MKLGKEGRIGKEWKEEKRGGFDQNTYTYEY